MKFLVVGCGLTGAVISRHLADAGHYITIIDQRSHMLVIAIQNEIEIPVLWNMFMVHISSTLAMKWYGNISINMVK
ncbi:NAD(P)-binding protein [Proteus mirabilis]|uniref:NAD(P)-binding protein n=1 Tax=Proteus mirabilis TaxID=584 RepID=UPI003C6E69A4